MRIRSRLAMLGAASVVAVAPLPAFAAGAAAHPTHTPPSKAKAYGRFCQGESKHHVAGMKGTPFSNCVTDMAKLASGKASNPHRVCANESKRHTAHTKGTPYSRCVAGGERLLHHH